MFRLIQQFLFNICQATNFNLSFLLNLVFIYFLVKLIFVIMIFFSVNTGSNFLKFSSHDTIVFIMDVCSDHLKLNTNDF